MTKRFTGVMLIFVSALLFISRYIVAAIGANGAGVAIVGVFEEVLNRTTPLLVASIVMLIVAIVYLVWAKRAKDK